MAKLTSSRDRISATNFAFPKQRKEPLENASHVRNAAARFNQVEGVTEAERRAAWNASSLRLNALESNCRNQPNVVRFGASKRNVMRSTMANPSRVELRSPAEPSPPPIKEPPSPPENPDAPVREPDPDDPDQI